jgi:hypothetical protein
MNDGEGPGDLNILVTFSKSFLLLFFKKEVLFAEMPIARTARFMPAGSHCPGKISRIPIDKKFF